MFVVIALGTCRTHRHRFTGREKNAPRVQGKISWATPIGKQLSGRVIGDHIAWSRGDEQIQLEIVDIRS